MDKEKFLIKISSDDSISLPERLINRAKMMGLINKDKTMTATDLELLLRD